jgi:hypothetical protein
VPYEEYNVTNIYIYIHTHTNTHTYMYINNLHKSIFFPLFLISTNNNNNNNNDEYLCGIKRVTCSAHKHSKSSFHISIRGLCFLLLSVFINTEILGLGCRLFFEHVVCYVGIYYSMLLRFSGFSKRMWITFCVTHYEMS